MKYENCILLNYSEIEEEYKKRYNEEINFLELGDIFNFGEGFANDSFYCIDDFRHPNILTLREWERYYPEFYPSAVKILTLLAEELPEGTDSVIVYISW